MTIPTIHAGDKKALVGGRLIDGFGHAPISNSVILVENDTILAVGTVDTLPVPEDYEVFSTDGMDVLPGLWESHAHLMLTGHADYPHWQATYLDRLADAVGHEPDCGSYATMADTAATPLNLPCDCGARDTARRVHDEIFDYLLTVDREICAGIRDGALQPIWDAVIEEFAHNYIRAKRDHILKEPAE